MPGRTTHFFASTAGQELLSEYKSALAGGRAFKSVKRHILFVCGGSAQQSGCLRGSFLDYANDNHVDAYHVFLAEQAFDALLELDSNIAHNLASFEEAICQIADCVIIFPESVGSYCETGYFAKVEGIRRKALIVNDLNHYAKNSFINDGPIKLINRDSKFSTAIPINVVAPDFAVIVDRLNSRLKVSSRRTVFDFSTYKDMSLQDKFFLINDIIKLFGPCSILSIEEILRSVFKSFNRNEIREVLSILQGAGLIIYSSSHPDYFLAADSNTGFLEYDGEFAVTFRAKLLEHYAAIHAEPDIILEALQGELL